MTRRSLLRTSDLTPQDALSIFELAAWLLPRLKPASPAPFKLETLRGISTALVFIEPSTRTRVSFELAAKLLSSDAVNVGAAGSSLEKGESLRDTAMTLNAMGFGLTVLRHKCADAAELYARYFDGPVINAGTGRSEHPTQALLDAFTLWQEGLLREGARLLIVGDIANSRVARSAATLLSRFGVRITLCAPPSLMPPAWVNSATCSGGVKPPVSAGGDADRRLDAAATAQSLSSPYPWIPDLDSALPGCDAVMLLRMQRERMDGAPHTGLSEYAKLYGLNARRLGLLPRAARILHPGPVNRGVELSEAVFADPRQRINQQVTNGLAIRAALLCWALGMEPRG